MEERRKNKRLELDVLIKLERLDEEGITSVREVYVTVNDLSKSGIGFHCDQELEVGSFYDTRLVIWTKECIDTVLRIVRRNKQGNTYEYGGEFIAMNETDAFKIQVYQLFDDAKKEKLGDLGQLEKK